jgi:hypothetical protein
MLSFRGDPQVVKAQLDSMRKTNQPILTPQKVAEKVKELKKFYKTNEAKKRRKKR